MVPNDSREVYVGSPEHTLPSSKASTLVYDTLSNTNGILNRGPVTDAELVASDLAASAEAYEPSATAACVSLSLSLSSKRVSLEERERERGGFTPYRKKLFFFFRAWEDDLGSTCRGPRVRLAPRMCGAESSLRIDDATLACAFAREGGGSGRTARPVKNTFKLPM